MIITSLEDLWNDNTLSYLKKKKNDTLPLREVFIFNMNSIRKWEGGVSFCIKFKGA